MPRAGPASNGLAPPVGAAPERAGRTEWEHHRPRPSTEGNRTKPNTAWIQILGYIASASVRTTFCMSTMIPLPTIGLASNVLFIGFGAVAHIYPVMIRHIAPLPVNAARLLQVRKLVRGLKGAGAGELSIEALSPFMSHRTFKAGSHADVALAEGVRTAADMGALPVVAAARDEAAATSAAARSAGRAGRVNAP